MATTKDDRDKAREQSEQSGVVAVRPTFMRELLDELENGNARIAALEAERDGLKGELAWAKADIEAMGNLESAARADLADEKRVHAANLVAADATADMARSGRARRPDAGDGRQGARQRAGASMTRAPARRMEAPMKLVIEGRPVTKKNSLRRIKRGRRVFTVPSAAHEAWEGPAVLQLQSQWQRWRSSWTGGHGSVDVPVNMRAVVYRNRAVGDLLNYLAAVSDVLERAGVLEDDKLVVSVDGSRMLVDRQRPRVEIELEAAT